MKSRILIDADGCPVVDLTVRIAAEYGVECLILCDTSHWFDKPGAITLVFSKGADSVDFALVNLLRRGDADGFFALCEKLRSEEVKIIVSYGKEE